MYDQDHGQLTIDLLVIEFIKNLISKAKIVLSDLSIKGEPKEEIQIASKVPRARGEFIHALNELTLLINSVSRIGIGVHNHFLCETMMKLVVPKPPESRRDEEWQKTKESEIILNLFASNDASMHEFMAYQAADSPAVTNHYGKPCFRIPRPLKGHNSVNRC